MHVKRRSGVSAKRRDGVGSVDVGASVVRRRNKSREASESPQGHLVSSLCFITIFPLLSPLSSTVYRWLQAAHIREYGE
ncbi:hypothetical protein Q5P01_001915 [Channa striata]|uniref:Uncharacterized protein n=1 Tax=Channa striata TaxID=64152 RepID=A0AA88T4C4_CHASR|nr:hypothetical protein Q5P01_001915 [Channa striata]